MKSPLALYLTFSSPFFFCASTSLDDAGAFLSKERTAEM